MATASTESHSNGGSRGDSPSKGDKSEKSNAEQPTKQAPPTTLLATCLRINDGNNVETATHISPNNNNQCSDSLLRRA